MAADVGTEATEAQYFDTYCDAEIHGIMLRDEPRNAAYERAFERLGDRLRGKVVADIGAGTGLLSMMAVRHGARHVYAVEASEMALMTRDIVEANGMSDRITVIKALAEDVELPELADVLVSEWMGFYLLHESMLGSVLHARDRLLRPGGIMLPGVATLWCAPVDMSEVVQRRMNLWHDVRGFDLSPMLPLAAASLIASPTIEVLRAEQVLGTPSRALVLDLHTATPRDLEGFIHAARFRLQREGVVCGIATWFDCLFVGSRAAAAAATAALQEAERQALRGGGGGGGGDGARTGAGGGAGGAGAGAAGSSSTDAGTDTGASGAAVPAGELLSVLDCSPFAPATHWKQTVFMLRDMYGSTPGTELPAGLFLRQDSSNPRHYVAEVRAGAEEVSELVPLYSSWQAERKRKAST